MTKILEIVFFTIPILILTLFFMVVASDRKRFKKSKARFRVIRRTAFYCTFSLIAAFILKSYNDHRPVKILEMTFFAITLLIVLVFFYTIFTNYKKTNTLKIKSRILRKAMTSFIIAFSLFIGTKSYNNSLEKSEPKAKETILKVERQKEEPVFPASEEIENEPSVEEQSEETGVNKTSKGFTIENRDGITYIDGYLVVNKTYPLPENYYPKGTHVAITSDMGKCEECIIEEAYQAYVKMKNDMANEGLKIWIASGYRSYNYQGGLYNSYTKRNGSQAADTYSARAGHSEHQSGYAFDLNSVTDAFASTREGVWVNQNCYKYGFIIRYPKSKESITGYKYESWHLRYVGVELAAELYNNGDWITMEEHFGITSSYDS